MRDSSALAVNNVVCLRIYSQVQSEDFAPFLKSSHKNTGSKPDLTDSEMPTDMFHAKSRRARCSAACPQGC